jgi:hypothetical protein
MPSAKPSTELAVFVLADGSKAELLETDGSQAVLEAEMPAPPGARLSLLHATQGSFSVKVQRCKKLEGPGKFRIDGRWLDLSRESRQKVLTLVR